jgi:hypothetical protein
MGSRRASPGTGEEFVLSFHVTGLSQGSASAKFRIFETARGRVVIATQLPQSEYAGLSVSEAAGFAIAACLRRLGPEGFIYLEHYNRHSYGLDVYEPTFNRILFAVEAGEVVIQGNPEIAIEDVATLTGLLLHEVRRL